MAMSENEFKISVVIPVFNRERYIARAVDSVLAQKFAAYEILVVDDGSSDGTADVLRGYGDKIRYIYQENAGVSAARNMGVEEAEGDWIAFLDSDDEWMECHLANQIKILSEHPDLVWSTGNFYDCLVSENRKGLRCTKNKADIYVNNGVLEDYFIGYRNDVSGNTNTMVIRKDILLENGLFVIGRVKAEDVDLWWKIAIKHPKIGYVFEPGSIYYIDVGEGHVSKDRDVDIFIDVITVHLKIARQENQFTRYRSFAVWQLSRWMRSMLFTSYKEGIRKLLREFSSILPLTVKMRYYLLTIFPGLTKSMCHLISKFVRKFNLRSKVVEKPLS